MPPGEKTAHVSLHGDLHDVIMPSGNRYWLEYDSVAVVVLLMGIGLVGLIVLII